MQQFRRRTAEVGPVDNCFSRRCGRDTTQEEAKKARASVSFLMGGVMSLCAARLKLNEANRNEADVWRRRVAPIQYSKRANNERDNCFADREHTAPMWNRRRAQW